MGNTSYSPEEMIFKQHDGSYEMFYITSGDCVVNIIDNENKNIIGHRLLVEGDHFGEIGLIYKCNRTASVVSRNYIFLAILSRSTFHDLMSEMPDLLNYLKRHVYGYIDPMKTFISQLMFKVPYFGNNYMNKHIFHKILYSF